MSQKFRVFKLRNQAEEDLSKGLDKLKEELSQLRTAKVAGGTASKLGRIGLVRKQIAKYMTVINEKVRSECRKSYENKKKLPLDLRAKKTRAIRQRLTRHQQKAQPLKALKRKQNFPMRKYALRA